MHCEICRLHLAYKMCVLRKWLCVVQFHGVALLHALRAGDRLAVSKLVTSLTQKNVRSSLAQCLLVR